MTMKRGQLLFSALVISFLMMACATAETHLQVTRPPDLKLDPAIVTIAVLDRSLPSDEGLTVLEGIVTGENIGQDRRGRKAVFQSLNEIMQDQNRFEVLMTGREMEGSKSGARMMPPLTNENVSKLSDEYGADALLVLESFDSDSRNMVTEAIEVASVLRTGIDPVLYSNNVRSSWRLYDGVTGRVIDEFHTYITPEGWWAYTDADPLTEHREVLAAADISAFQMAGRLVPVDIYLSRAFYRNSGLSNKKLKQAARLVRGERWEAAEEIWSDIFASDASRKTRGRAAYNLAVAYERKGQITTALEWTENAIMLGNDRAIAYAQELNGRQRIERE